MLITDACFSFRSVILSSVYAFILDMQTFSGFKTSKTIIATSKHLSVAQLNSKQLDSPNFKEKRKQLELKFA
jgi:hypothetical protein